MTAGERRVLPLLLSVPHAGLEVPDEVKPWCVLSREDILRDGDEGAAEVYAVQSAVAGFVTTPVARAIVDMNRAEDDRGKDGVVKTHTCWDVPIYRQPLPGHIVEHLLATYYRPYHAQLSAAAGTVRIGVDCHTMAAVGPPVAPDPGVERPMVCLGDGHGACPRPWVEELARCFRRHADGQVTINEPFAGGFITRSHGSEMPWVQVELSRSEAMSLPAKRAAVLAALADFCAWLDGGGADSR